MGGLWSADNRGKVRPMQYLAISLKSLEYI